MSQSIENKILKRIRAKRRGYVFTPSDFSAVGSRAGVDQALSRLARKGLIARLARGIYHFPELHPLVGEIPALPLKVAEAIARGAGGELQMSRAAAANELGLSTQVPGRAIYWTNARSRRRKVGGVVIELRQASPRRLAGVGTRAGTALQALRFLGPTGVNGRTVEAVRAALTHEERRQLAELAWNAPEWARPAVEKIVS